MTDKVTLPREVAEAIEDLRKDHYDNRALIDEIYEGATRPVLQAYAEANFDTLLNALVNGYEIEKSPEDKVREYFKQLSECWFRLFKEGDTNNLGVGYLHRMEAVMHTLNLLGIEIPGVNAPIEGVNADA
jgi:deoxyadenosine/deoxycytidine kinase